MEQFWCIFLLSILRKATWIDVATSDLATAIQSSHILISSPVLITTTFRFLLLQLLKTKFFFMDIVNVHVYPPPQVIVKFKAER